MAAEQRKLLEQLMGGGMAARPGQQLSLDDPKVCRSYLAGVCPHDLFTNTKQDLGMCPKVHSELLKAEYDALAPADKARHGFEYDYLRDLQKYLDECNRRIDVAQRRLEKTPDEIRQTNELLRTISDLSNQIDNGLLEAEVLGDAGLIGPALDAIYLVRQTMQTRADRERDLKTLSDTGGPSGHQKLQVCDVCGAYLSRLDNDRRLADHFYGKMHLGYAQMRKAYEALSKDLGRAPRSRGPPAPVANDRGDSLDDGGRSRGPRGGGGGRRNRDRNRW